MRQVYISFVANLLAVRSSQIAQESDNISGLRLNQRSIKLVQRAIEHSVKEISGEKLINLACMLIET